MGTNEDWYKYVLKLKGKRLTRASAIKNYCKLECCAGDVESWRNCTIPNCFLWRFRMGRELFNNQTSCKKSKGKHIVSEQKTLSQQEDGRNANN